MLFKLVITLSAGAELMSQLILLIAFLGPFGDFFLFKGLKFLLLSPGFELSYLNEFDFFTPYYFSLSN